MCNSTEFMQNIVLVLISSCNYDDLLSFKLEFSFSCGIVVCLVSFMGVLGEGDLFFAY